MRGLAAAAEPCIVFISLNELKFLYIFVSMGQPSSENNAAKQTETVFIVC